MTKTLLIGGAGFIGTELGRVLLREGREVTVVSRGLPAAPETGVSYLQGDYGAPAVLQHLSEFDEVVLLAYSSIPKTSFDDPMADLTDNLPRVLEFFKAATACHLKKIVFVSTGGAVYGKTGNGPVSESHPTNPISPYGITKLTIEKYGLMYHALYGLPVTMVRPSNAYGIGQKPFTGQGFVATAIASILEGKPLTLFGERGAVRDYVYVTDMAEGIFAALDRGTIGATYNLGTGLGLSTREIVEKLKGLAAARGLEVAVSTEPERAFDVPVNILDSTALRQATGWEPKVPFDRGLQTTWDWFQAKEQA